MQLGHPSTLQEALEIGLERELVGAAVENSDIGYNPVARAAQKKTQSQRSQCESMSSRNWSELWLCRLRKVATALGTVPLSAGCVWPEGAHQHAVPQVCRPSGKRPRVRVGQTTQTHSYISRVCTEIEWGDSVRASLPFQAVFVADSNHLSYVKGFTLGKSRLRLFIISSLTLHYQNWPKY